MERTVDPPPPRKKKKQSLTRKKRKEEKQQLKKKKGGGEEKKKKKQTVDCPVVSAPKEVPLIRQALALILTQWPTAFSTLVPPFWPCTMCM